MNQLWDVEVMHSFDGRYYVTWWKMWGSEWRRAGDGKNLVIDAGVMMSKWWFLWTFPKALNVSLKSPKRIFFVFKWESTRSISIIWQINGKSVPEDPDIKLFPKFASQLPKEGFWDLFMDWSLFLTLFADSWGKQPAVDIFAENRGSNVGCVDWWWPGSDGIFILHLYLYIILSS